MIGIKNFNNDFQPEMHKKMVPPLSSLSGALESAAVARMHHARLLLIVAERHVSFEAGWHIC